MPQDWLATRGDSHGRFHRPPGSLFCGLGAPLAHFLIGLFSPSLSSFEISLSLLEISPSSDL